VCRHTFIVLEEVRAVLRRNPFVCLLCGNGSHVTFILRYQFLLCRTRLNTALSAVIADTRVIDGDIVDDCLVDIHIPDDSRIHVRDSAVVIEVVSAPGAARKSGAKKSETVVHAAIEANVRTPISRMPEVAARAPTPVAGRPQ
jgi:hypothetical protein